MFSEYGNRFLRDYTTTLCRGFRQGYKNLVRGQSRGYSGAVFGLRDQCFQVAPQAAEFAHQVAILSFAPGIQDIGHEGMG